jgi:hypothetical protein
VFDLDIGHAVQVVDPPGPLPLFAREQIEHLRPKILKDSRIFSVRETAARFVAA